MDYEWLRDWIRGLGDDLIGALETAVKKNIASRERLRDYFAGQALAGLCALELGPTNGDGNWQAAHARSAYELADAMLAEREKAKGDGR